MRSLLRFFFLVLCGHRCGAFSDQTRAQKDRSKSAARLFRGQLGFICFTVGDFTDDPGKCSPSFARSVIHRHVVDCGNSDGKCGLYVDVEIEKLNQLDFSIVDEKIQFTLEERINLLHSFVTEHG